MAAKKPTIAQLQAEIEALRRRVQELEARPPVVIHNYPPAQPAPGYTFPLTPWQPGQVWCGVAEAKGAVGMPWNGPRNPDGSCAPIGSAVAVVGTGALAWNSDGTCAPITAMTFTAGTAG